MTATTFGALVAYACALRGELDDYLHHGEGHSARVAVLTDPADTEAVVLLVEGAAVGRLPHPVVCEALCAPVADVARAAGLSGEWAPVEDGWARVSALLCAPPPADALSLICAAIGGAR